MTHRRTRRLFLTDLGRTTAGLIVVGTGLTGCTNEDEGAIGPLTDPTTPATPAVGTTPPEPADAESEGGGSEAAGPEDGATEGQASGGGVPAVVDLGFVAAYVVMRDGQAAVVDTGVEGSEGDILTVLAAGGLGWQAVSDIVVTHNHGDHAGSLPAVSDLAADAAIHAGEGDIPSMRASRPITAVGDGDVVFGLQVVTTPGHTPGHISLVDPVARFMLTGDALVGDGSGGLAGPPPEFTAHMPRAIESVAKLAAFDVEQVLVCHGFPTSAGSAELQALADSLRA